MDALQQLWHLLNLLTPPLAWAALHSALCKLLWRRGLGAVSWLRLTAWCALAAEAAHGAGLWWNGRDGAMWTYGVTLLALVLTTWLVGFTPWRRSAG
jgi:hypothetical protein